MPGTSGVNPGSISRETTDGAPNKDTSNAGTAGNTYTGSSSGPTTDSLGTHPFSGGTPNPTNQSNRPSGTANGR
ncbi:MAG TPA: hypothetical protein VHW90_09910 [Stellaceae bacterium]|nr:hypothetical protein [Stellaceae bacterium]